MADVRLQRTLDDGIYRDRNIADEQLLKFRDRIDAALAVERSASPFPGSKLVSERVATDHGKKVERRATDALLESERLRADTAVEVQRQDTASGRTDLDRCRVVTDDQLGKERYEVDAAVNALSDSRSALAFAKTSRLRREDVLGIVIHDLRGPLSVISLSSESIVKHSQEAFSRDAAQGIALSAARMERLLLDLLDVVRIDAGTLRIAKQEQDLSVLLAEVLKTYGPLFAARGIAFSIDAQAGAIVAAFDYDRIVQVFSNLFGNAMKFTPRGGTVELRVEQQGEVEFALHDSGCGIAAAALEHVFERFWQIDDDSRRGLGLGLHICEKIVQAHGGRIWAESDPGHGTTIRFTLPVE
jgi:signal transduction histidine kinase